MMYRCRFSRIAGLTISTAIVLVIDFCTCCTYCGEYGATRGCACFGMVLNMSRKLVKTV